MLDCHLRNYFVFFLPKAVVSGDFYWGARLKNGHFAFCCADSTGHGVPGAIMSILNISSLEKAIETEVEADQILFKTRSSIIDRLKKDGSLDGGKDGMDCSLLVFNTEKSEVTFAGANNPIVVVRQKQIIEFKGDKIPAGRHDYDQKPFSIHRIPLQKNDVIYTFTDGMSDQFGGPKGKKFLYKKLKDLFLEIADHPMEQQADILNRSFQTWKGTLEQIDDVCVFGIKI